MTLQPTLLRAIAAAAVIAISSAGAYGAAAAEGAELAQRYQQHLEARGASDFGGPLVVASTQSGDVISGHVYAELPQAFAGVAATLSEAGHWCGFAILHTNVKACTASGGPTNPAPAALVDLYVGRKSYQTPDAAFRVQYQFRVVQRSTDFLAVRLDADAGPLGTRDYHIVLESTPLTAQSSIVHFHYTYRTSFAADLAMGSYLATLGAGKVGFSILGHDEHGTPIYVQGLRGAMERNTVRYFLAIQTYLEDLGLPDAQRFDTSLARWYELTQHYKRQLYDLDRGEYLAAKHREHLNQLAYQARLAPAS